MRILRHFNKLMKEFAAYAWENKVWWIVPMVLVLLALCVLLALTQGAATSVYTFF